MDWQELFHSFVILFVLLGTLLLLFHSLAPVKKSQQQRSIWPEGLWEVAGQLGGMFRYCLAAIAQMPPLLLLLLLIYGLVLSFFYWYLRHELSLLATLGLSILTTVVSLAGIALLLAPILFITRRVLFDYVLESKIFRMAIYSVFIPFIYILVIHDVKPGRLAEGIMLAGMALSYYQIFRGMVYCLHAPGTVSSQSWGNRFVPILMIISWLLIIIFNLYTLILLVSNSDHHAFMDSSGPVAGPLRLLYFTVITFTGVGYGDITPRGNLAVLITIIVSVTGFLYSALFVGSILAAFTTGRRRD